MRYISFSAKDMESGTPQEVAIGYPGYLYGIYFRAKAGDGGIISNGTRVSIADIGCMKNYIMKEAPIHTFIKGDTPNFVAPDNWTNSGFIFLDYKIYPDHKCVVEMNLYSGNIGELYGDLIYTK